MSEIESSFSSKKEAALTMPIPMLDISPKSFATRDDF
ncbi:predicted protein [Botrytis cinerea T4]|uniref:Uncharacterized protein n=1 Tax=Botryotinia fuckeliana (strain T4) TaxID=999810 RepID=G2Y2R2_BOTF4|nr:predicted protein [Botrytis cinerea T4]